MTKEDAYNLVSARYNLCRSKRTKSNLAKFGNLVGWEVFLNGGILLLNVAGMLENNASFYVSVPEIAATCHAAATVSAFYFANASNRGNKGTDKELSDEMLTLQCLNSEICNGTNRFRNVEIEDFDEHLKELVKTTAKK